MEWWDEVVLDGGHYDTIPAADVDMDEKYQKAITNLVEHPIQLKPPDEPLTPQYLKVSTETESQWVTFFKNIQISQ